ncbi:hypothetical protein C8F01DRAFT_1256549 [Mycena amicta]|nr:hypothetical protein C8F01DRAFT_1256549 [Mycena amicta]
MPIAAMPLASHNPQDEPAVMSRRLRNYFVLKDFRKYTRSSVAVAHIRLSLADSCYGETIRSPSARSSPETLYPRTPSRWLASAPLVCLPLMFFYQADSSAPVTTLLLDPNHSKGGALRVACCSHVVTVGFRTKFGGGRSTSFALIDDDPSQSMFEPIPCRTPRKL